MYDRTREPRWPENLVDIKAYCRNQRQAISLKVRALHRNHSLPIKTLEAPEIIEWSECPKTTQRTKHIKFVERSQVRPDDSDS